MTFSVIAPPGDEQKLRDAIADDDWLRPERLRTLRQRDATPAVAIYLADPLDKPVR